MTLLLLIIGSLIFLVVLSFAVEALRQRPTAPATLYWAPKIPIQTTVIDGNTIRYIKTGKGGGPRSSETRANHLSRLSARVRTRSVSA
jgi:hypothetical protein